MKKAEKTEITRRKILNAALQEFGTYGYEGTTVNQLCRKYELSKGLLYHNFGNKEQLYLHCVEDAVASFVDWMSICEYGTDFRKYMQRRYAFFAENPCCSRLIFEENPTGDSAFACRLAEIRNRFFQYNRDVYIRAIDSVQLREGITREEAIAYYGFLQNLLNRQFSFSGGDGNAFGSVFLSREKSLEKILDFILYGIAGK